MNKIYLSFNLIFSLFVFITFLYAFNEYPGNKIIYLCFSFISIFHLYYGLRKNSYFVDKFIAIFFWLGFWFKFSFEFAYRLWGAVNFREGIGVFEKTGNAYDGVLLISSVGITAFIFSSFINKYIFSTHKISLNNSENFFYNKNKKKIYLIFYLIIFIVSSLNIYFGIYQKGIIPNENISVYISYLFRWLLLFGFTSITCILLHFEINNKIINYKLVFLAFFESFISNLSLLSRSAIFNFLSIFFGLFYYLKKITFKKKVFSSLIIFSLFLFFLNISSVNKIRDFKFYEKDLDSMNYNFFNLPNYNKDYLEYKNYLATSLYTEAIKIIYKKDTNFKFNIFELRNNPDINLFTSNLYDIIYLMTNRWVGIDALMAVYAKENDLSFELIIQSLNEKFQENTYSFFEKKFLLRDENKKENENLINSNAVILPGLIAYLYFSGSKFFLFFSIFVLMFICYSLERLSYKVSQKNMIFTAFMGYIFASRIAHSGYLVSNNFKYLLALLLNLFVIYLIVMIFKKLDKI